TCKVQSFVSSENDDVILVGFISIAFHAQPGERTFRGIEWVGVRPLHTLSAVRRLARSHFICVQVGVGTHCVCSPRFFLRYINDKSAIRTPGIVFIPTERFLW